MNLIEGGEPLLVRRLNGEKLSRREAKDLDFWMRWRTCVELEHICATLRGQPLDDNDAEATMAVLGEVEEVE